MKITLKQIIDTDPYKDRLDHFLKTYPNFVSSDLESFVMLEEITYCDKIWVLIRLMTNVERLHFALSCADSTLHIFESRYPDEKRPRDVLDFLLNLNDPATLTAEELLQLQNLRIAAHSAYTSAISAAYTAYAEARPDATYDAYAYASLISTHASANSSTWATSDAYYNEDYDVAYANSAAYAYDAYDAADSYTYIDATIYGAPADNKSNREDLNLIFAYDILVNSRS